MEMMMMMKKRKHVAGLSFALAVFAAIVWVSFDARTKRIENLRKLSTVTSLMDPRTVESKDHHAIESSLQVSIGIANVSGVHNELRDRQQSDFPNTQGEGLSTLPHENLRTESHDGLAAVTAGHFLSEMSGDISRSTSDVLYRNNHFEKQRLQKLLYSRNKNILALGGSTTWGSKLESRDFAYPSLIPQLLGPTWRAYNLAVRATDASYASQCIESMIREGVKNKLDIEFDVIMLEYSLNGIDGMSLLLKRLRHRFPKAIFIYVHLWSLRMTVDNAVTGAKPRDELSRGLPFKEADLSINNMLADPSARWGWAAQMKHDSEQIEQSATALMNAVGGHVYSLPMPNTPQIALDEHWFGPDYHHLSNEGHALVAEHLVKLLQDEQITGPPKQLDIYGIPLAPDKDIGSWGEGDQCYSWYETGIHPNIRVDGGTVKNFVKNDKWAVNVGLKFGQPANIWFSNMKATLQPVMIMIMSWGPGVYPKSRIDLQSPGLENQSSTLDPLHANPLYHVFHVTRTAHVGWASPGESRLTVDPIEDMKWPLRVIGIVMCAACVEMDETFLSNGSSHQRLGGILSPPVPLAEQEDQISPDYLHDYTGRAQSIKPAVEHQEPMADAIAVESQPKAIMESGQTRVESSLTPEGQGTPFDILNHLDANSSVHVDPQVNTDESPG